jgi:hypothetical protein
MQLDLGDDGQRLRQVWLLALFERRHGAVEHLGKQVEADFLHLSRLVGAQHFTGAADFEVMHGEVETGAEFVHHLDCLQALPGLLVERCLVVRQQVGVGLMVRAPDPAA